MEKCYPTSCHIQKNGRKVDEKVELLTDNSNLLLEKSMGFLWTKQAAILDNISNAETPNYKEKVVTFEESLRSKLQQAGQGSNAKKSVRNVLEDSDFYVTETQESTRMDDNGVNITEQTTELVRNSYQLQYVMRSIKSNLSILETAIKG
jgi:flagellar basal-body rod protein FlgB